MRSLKCQDLSTSATAVLSNNYTRKMKIHHVSMKILYTRDSCLQVTECEKCFCPRFPQIFWKILLLHEHKYGYTVGMNSNTFPLTYIFFPFYIILCLDGRVFLHTVNWLHRQTEDGLLEHTKL